MATRCRLLLSPLASLIADANVGSVLASSPPTPPPLHLAALESQLGEGGIALRTPGIIGTVELKKAPHNTRQGKLIDCGLLYTGSSALQRSRGNRSKVGSFAIRREGEQTCAGPATAAPGRQGLRTEQV